MRGFTAYMDCKKADHFADFVYRWLINEGPLYIKSCLTVKHFRLKNKKKKTSQKNPQTFLINAEKHDQLIPLSISSSQVPFITSLSQFRLIWSTRTRVQLQNEPVFAINKVRGKTTEPLKLEVWVQDVTKPNGMPHYSCSINRPSTVCLELFRSKTLQSVFSHLYVNRRLTMDKLCDHTFLNTWQLIKTFCLLQYLLLYSGKTKISLQCRQ